MRQTMRQVIGRLVAPVLRASGFRFSKAYRHGATPWHRWVYALVDTVGANIRAEEERGTR